MSEAYRQAGVNLGEGKKFIQGISNFLDKKQFSPNSFAAISDISAVKNFEQPVIVSATDGVGTKIHLSQLFDDFTAIGIDLVAMVANDILTTGCPTQFFLDYLACEKIQQTQMQSIIQSIHKGCQIAQCTLIGGETAEHPGLMHKGSFDLAGFGFGIMDRKDAIDAKKIREGDVLIGLPSSGIHANGYSLVRKIFTCQKDYGLEKFHAHFVKPATILYWPILAPILKSSDRKKILAMAHITGGGLAENVARILPAGLAAKIDTKSWMRPPVFDAIQRKGKLSDKEMFPVFNMGIGFTIVCPSNEAKIMLQILQRNWAKTEYVLDAIAEPTKNFSAPPASPAKIRMPEIIGEIVQASPPANKKKETTNSQWVSGNLFISR